MNPGDSIRPVPDGGSQLFRLDDLDLIAEARHPGHEVVDLFDFEKKSIAPSGPGSSR